jgi:hypothetical protein
MSTGTRIAGVFALMVFSSMLAHAQVCELQKSGDRDFHMTGDLYGDFIARQCLSDLRPGIDSTGDLFRQKQYSPLQAGLFSAVVPGAGQFYTKRYWESAAFLGAEVLMWVVYATYEGKGDRQTNDFQNYADANWSVVRYAYWIQANYASYYRPDIFNGTPPSPDVSQPWQYVNWTVLNAVEDEIGQLPTSDPTHLTGFSHDLPPRPEQQYYEEIGKYPQYGGGWGDASSFKPGGFTSDDLLAGNVSPNFLKYSKMRGDANSFYNVATTISYVIVANHVFSAVEAAWNASRINNRIHLQGHIRSRVIQSGLVEFVPTIDFELSF